MDDRQAIAARKRQIRRHAFSAAPRDLLLFVLCAVIASAVTTTALSAVLVYLPLRVVAEFVALTVAAFDRAVRYR